MRKWFVSLGVLGFAAATASAQVIPPDAAAALRFYKYDNGSRATGWKKSFPAAAGDWYNVDFDDDARGKQLLGIAVGSDVTSPGRLGVGKIGVYPDNLALDPFGHTPDVSSPISSLTNPTGQPTGGNGNFTVYDVPNVVLPTSGVSVALHFVTNDSGMWLDSDSSSSLGHSYYSTDNFATASIPFSISTNWMLRIGTPHYSPNGGEFLINGTSNAAVGGLHSMALQMWARDVNAPTFYLQELDLGGPLVPLPGIVLSTGFSNFAPNGIQSLGELSGSVPCNAMGNTLTFKAFFEDNLDLKKNGHKKIKLTTSATVAITSSAACCPTLCFGAKDDGVWTGGGQKANQPAGANDWYTVHHGFALPPGVNVGCPGAVNNLLGVSAFSQNLCGGPATSWAEVGIYQSNLTQDPSGNTPDVSAPLTSVTGVSAAVPPGHFDWAYPATFYDTPDISANSTTDYHTGMHWATGDSCLWMEVDFLGTGDDFGNDCAKVPASSSFFSTNGFATNAIPVSYNWMQRIDWN